MFGQCGASEERLAYFGEFGIRGVGYYVKDLLQDIRRILGLNKEWKMAVIGIGNLGSALLSIKTFSSRIIDCRCLRYRSSKGDRKGFGKVGKPVEILHINRIKEVAKERKIEIGIITTPPSEVQNVAKHLVEAEVRGILNFAPAHITVPDGYVVKDVFFHHHSRQFSLSFIKPLMNERSTLRPTPKSIWAFLFPAPRIVPPEYVDLTLKTPYIYIPIIHERSRNEGRIHPFYCHRTSWT